jgi:hypothetical protein
MTPVGAIATVAVAAGGGDGGGFGGRLASTAAVLAMTSPRASMAPR